MSAARAGLLLLGLTASVAAAVVHFQLKPERT